MEEIEDDSPACFPLPALVFAFSEVVVGGAEVAFGTATTADEVIFAEVIAATDVEVAKVELGDPRRTEDSDWDEDASKGNAAGDVVLAVAFGASVVEVAEDFSNGAWVIGVLTERERLVVKVVAGGGGGGVLVGDGGPGGGGDVAGGSVPLRGAVFVGASTKLFCYDVRSIGSWNK